MRPSLSFGTYKMGLLRLPPGELDRLRKIMH